MGSYYGHQLLAGSIHAYLINQLKAEGCKCSVYQPIGYKVNEDTIIQPDLLVVCKPIEKQYLGFRPSLVVEIISPSSVLKDRHTKLDIYQSESIPYYIIVDPESKEAEVYALVEGQYMITDKEIQLDEDSQITKDFSSTFW